MKHNGHMTLAVCEVNHLQFYRVPIHNIQHLKQRIREATATVTADVLGRVRQDIEYLLDVCIATNWAHIELDKHVEKTEFVDLIYV
jgi:hypothetical protein